jgi:hypothetical protein
VQWWTEDRIKQLRAIWEQCYQCYGDFCHYPLIGNQTLDGSSWALFSNNAAGTNPKVHPALDYITKK